MTGGTWHAVWHADLAGRWILSVRLSSDPDAAEVIRFETRVPATWEHPDCRTLTHLGLIQVPGSPWEETTEGRWECSVAPVSHTRRVEILTAAGQDP